MIDILKKTRRLPQPLRNIAITILCAIALLCVIKHIPKTEYLYLISKDIILISLCLWIVIYLTKKIQKLKFLFKPLKYSILTLMFIAIIFIALLLACYNYCIFPDDQDYLRNKAASVKYSGNSLEEIELDLIRHLKSAQIVNPLKKNDVDFLLSNELKKKDYYIDANPYSKYSSFNNLKYSTGRIFYYIYQKNSLVLKENSKIVYYLKKSGGDKRFVEFDTVLPEFEISDSRAFLRVYFTGNKKRLLLEKEITKEKKPDIMPFRYSDPISSLLFYLKHPGRSVLTDYVGWEKIRQQLPTSAGKLELEFSASGGSKDYLFLGSPAVYAVKDNKRDDHLNIVYLIFDTLAKYHIDLYEYYDTFKDNSFREALSILGDRKIITPAIDKYFGNTCLFDSIYTAGQVTRPSIVSLWNSQVYTKSRLPVFRNIVTDRNRNEYHNLCFSTLADELSKNGYFTKQISCNAQGHGVSGVGVDLGFDENYDYTMETSELTENFRRIIEFLNENQRRKFFLYSHINVPHTPRWIPMRHFLSAYWDCDFMPISATILGNIRYMNDCLEHIMNAVKKLGLHNNTIIIITSDHSMGRVLNFRGEDEKKDWLSIVKRESQMVATNYNHSIYVRKGDINLYNSIVNVPWILIAPANLNLVPGRIKTPISALDISPTLLDLTLGKKCGSFSGKSFKRMLYGKDIDEINNNLIPLVGRFQRGFVYKGMYKYWINIRGLYKYRETKDKKRLIMQQEYLYDLQNDPYETINLALDKHNKELLKKMRKLYLERYIDYPDKNFIQIAPSWDGKEHVFTIKVKVQKGKIIYPEVYGKDVSFKRNGHDAIVFNAKVSNKRLYLSFETDPSDSPLTIFILKDGRTLPENKIFSSVERINIFDNPIRLKGRADFHIARVPGKTGLEETNIPDGSVYFSRAPLNYWLEMNSDVSDISLSPGIKEVLRGWGYIQ